MPIQLTEKSRRAWEIFLNNQNNHGHVNREISGIDIDEHVSLCMNSSEAMAKRVKHDLPSGFKPLSILEIGSSSGLNCYALKDVFPDAMVTGIEPEIEAVETALSMKVDSAPEFIHGVGEKLPFANNSIDLIVCHTVIEHVQNVQKVIREFSRVLATNGVIHLDAPNYIWPYEPHLQIWTIPILGKGFVKWSAIMQGKTEMTGFLEHLHFVTPFQLQRIFWENGLVWENRAEKKLLAAVTGTAEIKKYKFASKMLQLLGKLGVAKVLVCTLVHLGIYPSVMYTLRKDIDA